MLLEIEQRMIHLVTLDFHNTIAQADDWFQLEIRELPARVLQILDPEALARIGEPTLTQAYRDMRHQVMQSGVEVEAIDGLERVYRTFDLELPRESLADATAELMRQAVSTATPMNGAVEAIRKLHAAGLRIGVISSAVYHPFLVWCLEEFGVIDQIEFVITSASSGKYKSDPSIYTHALHLAQLESGQAIHVGDSLNWDIGSAHQAGLKAIFVDTGIHLSAMQHDSTAIPDATVSDLLEAADWILGQSSEKPSKQLSPTLVIDIFTLFPPMFTGVLTESILKRGQQKGLIDIRVHDIRDWTYDRHRTADDTPYGGGAGMVLKAPPIVEAVESVLGDELGDAHVIITSAGGRRFNQTIAQELSERRRVVIICGHYEGIDERVSEILNADEISIGDYVLTGGELPAMVIADTICRLVPGVITEASILDESHLGDGVEYPHYTRPHEYRGLVVPDILLSGHHAKIAEWREDRARERTARWRPDLLEDM